MCTWISTATAPSLGKKRDVYAHVLGHVFVTSWMVALQAPLSMGFPGKNTGVGSHFLF